VAIRRGQRLDRRDLLHTFVSIISDDEPWAVLDLNQCLRVVMSGCWRPGRVHGGSWRSILPDAWTGLAADSGCRRLGALGSEEQRGGGRDR